MHDIVDKYYAICEILNDDIHKAAFLIKIAGAHQRPSFIAKDVSFLWICKYEDQINLIYEAIQNKALVSLLKEISIFAFRTGKKYNFDPMVEAKVSGYKECKNINTHNNTIKYPTLF